MKEYAREGFTLHTMMTTPARDEKIQLTTMVFERDIPGTTVNNPVSVTTCPRCGGTITPGTSFCGGCGFRIG